MGYIRNHTIIVEGDGKSFKLLKDSDPFPLRTAHRKAKTIFPYVSPISPIAINGSAAFFIPPDGSKEGWDDSNKGDERRDEFVDFLRTTGLAWVEVQFGDDEGITKIIRHSDEN